jgi:transposase
MQAQALPAEKLLAVYKEQGISVERGFRFLKDPLFFAESLFLKRPERLMALLMVMGLALLIYTLAERKVRGALAEQKQTIPDQKGRSTLRPTLRRIFQMFEGIDLLLIRAGDRIQERHLLNLTPLHRQILDLLGTEVQKCYLLST